MAFHTSLVPLQRAFERALVVAAQERNYLTQWHTQLAGNITALDALNWVTNLNRVIDELTTIAATPGLVAYGKAQYDAAAYDISAEFSTMLTALSAVRGWLRTNLPANSVSVSSGVLSGTTYAPAATAPLRALIQTAINTID